MKFGNVNRSAVIALALLPGVLFLRCSCAAEGRIKAIVVHVRGDVELRRSGGNDLTAVVLSGLLYAGDEIKTGPSGRASLVTKGGAEVRINGNSDFDIEEDDKAGEMIRLDVGQVWTRMLHKMAKLDVITPSATCSIRGTEADIKQRGLLTVRVYEGHVDVQNSSGKRSLAAGQLSTVPDAGVAPAAPRRMSASEVGNWQNGITAKDIRKYMDKLNAEAGSGKKLEFKIVRDGKSKDVRIRLIKKQGGGGI